MGSKEIKACPSMPPASIILESRSVYTDEEDIVIEKRERRKKDMKGRERKNL